MIANLKYIGIFLFVGLLIGLFVVYVKDRKQAVEDKINIKIIQKEESDAQKVQEAVRSSPTDVRDAIEFLRQRHTED